MENERMYNISEVSKILGVHKETVRIWHRAGKIKTVQIGQGWIRIPESEIKRLLGE